jgi:two-component system response regulator DevR
MTKIKLIIVDDTDIAREGLRRILEREPDVEVLGAFESPESAIAFAKNNPPDVLMTDIKFWGGYSDALHMIRTLRAEMKNIGIIAISAYEALLADAKDAGADAFLFKGFPAREIVDVIRSVYEKKVARDHKNACNQK